MSAEIGNLSLSIKPEALRIAIESGRLLELADTISREAALQISAQLVQHVADAALKPDLMKSGVAANVSFIFEEGDFGTVPHRPHFGVVNLASLAAALASPLTRVAAGSAVEVG
jgi:hypothetical protein